MSSARVERHLRQASDRLRAARDELAVIDHQLAALASEADEARVRALVADDPLAAREHRDARRSADAMARTRAATVATIADLERTVDELLERFVPDAR